MAFEVASAIAFVLLIAGLIVLANRGLRRQQGNDLQRTAEEERAAGRFTVGSDRIT